MNHPTPTERLLIRQVIGDPVFTAEFYTTPEGVKPFTVKGDTLRLFLPHISANNRYRW